MFLLLLVGVLGVYLYKFANAHQTVIAYAQPEALDNATIQSASTNDGWISQLANITKQDFSLAVNEIYIEYKRPNKNASLKTAFELFVDKNDIYSMFCLTQTLKNTNVNFTIVKDGVKSKIFLNTQDSEVLQRIILELKTYDIHSSVTEVKI
ncbi:hypothetical protein [Campylobacter suis]|uniref:hypothetical protein n=1 Tax=Campylobacter suis TaxID=2790657 RepID=UPI001E655F67|nr:hypothetical protein [Campylobacter suis]